MPASAYLVAKVIDLTLRNVAMSAVATAYVSLHTANPGTTGANEIDKLTATWYLRKAGTFPAPTAGVTSNSVAIQFSAVTIAAVTVSHFGVWDAESNGNMLYYGSLASSKTLNISDVPFWAIGTLQVTAV
jgi:hypothetical protein